MIDAPYPPAPLWPNARPHWGTKARAAKQYKLTLWALTREAIQAGRLVPPNSPLVGIRLECWPAGGTPPDDDNVEAAFKHGRDGIAEALGINDRTMLYLPLAFRERVKGGRIRVTLYPLTEPPGWRE